MTFSEKAQLSAPQVEELISAASLAEDLALKLNGLVDEADHRSFIELV